MIMYTILPLSDVTQPMINHSLNSSFTSLRLSLNGIKAVMKFDTFNDRAKVLFETYPWYNYANINTEMEKAEWTEENTSL